MGIKDSKVFKVVISSITGVCVVGASVFGGYLLGSRLGNTELGYITTDNAYDLRKPEYSVYYSSGSDTDTLEVYYNKGAWAMFLNGQVTQLQQYDASPTDKSVYEVVSQIPNFNDMTATYYGYNKDGTIIKVDKVRTAKDVGMEYIFAEWSNNGYYYTYTFQKQDVSVFSVYTDESNLFRVYSADIMNYYENQEGTSEGKESTTETEQVPDNTEVTTENTDYMSEIIAEYGDTTE